MSEFNFNNSTPAAPAGQKNMQFQLNTSTGEASANYQDLEPELEILEDGIETFVANFCTNVRACY